MSNKTCVQLLIIKNDSSFTLHYEIKNKIKSNISFQMSDLTKNALFKIHEEVFDSYLRKYGGIGYPKFPSQIFNRNGNLKYNYERYEIC